MAEKYSSARDQFGSEKYLDKLVDLLKPRSKVLDVGCGAGKPVDNFLVDRGFEVIGIDISKKQIELAKQNISKANFEIKDMSKLRKGEYRVDAVVSFYAIFHIPRESHGDLFKKMSSFLLPDGLLLVTMGSSEWEGKEDNFYGAKMWWSHYDPKKNREIIESAGFEILLDEIDTAGEERHQVVLAKKRSV